MKYNIENFTSNPKLGIDVKEEIERSVGFKIKAKTGFLAGQSVVSAIMKMVRHKADPVFNDVDIFIETIDEVKLLKQDRYKGVLERSNALTGGGSKIITEISYDQMKSWLHETYSVTSSFRHGNLNYTFIEMPGEGHFLSPMQKLAHVVNGFDINSTQAGINLATNELYIAPGCLNFLYGNQLEIVNYNTPIHSIVRLAKKHMELNNSYVNMEEEILFAQYISALELDPISRKMENILETPYSMRGFPLFFGAKHFEEAKKLSSITQNFEFLQKICLERQYPAVGPNTSADVSPLDKMINYSKNKQYLLAGRDKSRVENLWTLSGLHSNDADLFVKKEIEKIRENIGSSPEDFNLNLDNISKNVIVQDIKLSRRVRKSTKKYFQYALDRFDGVNNEEREPFFLRNILSPTFGSVADMKGVSVDTMNRILKMLRSHNLDMVFSGKSFEESAELYRVIKLAEKEFGQFIYGYLETNYLLFPVDKSDYKSFLFKKLNLYVKGLEKELIKPLLEKSWTDGPYKFTEITNGLSLKKEGSEMHHCVGGYSSSVKSGRSKIFQVEKNDGVVRVTVEYKLGGDSGSEGEVYQLIQARGKRNDVYKKEIAYDFLNRLSQKFIDCGVLVSSNMSMNLSSIFIVDEKDQQRYQAGRFNQPVLADANEIPF